MVDLGCVLAAGWLSGQLTASTRLMVQDGFEQLPANLLDPFPHLTTWVMRRFAEYDLD
jgi:hypothetical protein